MYLLLIYPEVAKESALKLADALDIEALNPFNTDERDFTEYTGVINYGCNRKITYQNIFNTAKAVSLCADKVSTFITLNKANIPTVGWITEKGDIPKEWKTIVVRNQINAAKNEGMQYVEQGEPVPFAPLYTEYFPHTEEYRVCVFNKQFSVAYEKIEEEEGTWSLIKRDFKYLSSIKMACIEAAKALDIDFVGFDVLANQKGEFRVLEANSAPILTDEMLSLFLKYFKG